MKKLIFLLIPLLLTSLVSSCALVTNDSEVLKQKTLRQIEQAKERAEQKQKTLRQIEDAKARARQKLTPQKQMEYARARQIELSEYAKARARQKQTEQELYKKEQEAKYKRFKEEWVEFIQNEDGSLKNKTTQEIKKLVDQWNYYWTDHLIERMGWYWVSQNAEEVSNLEIFYKIFGKPWKTQFIEDRYILWYTCKGGNALITVSEYSFDDDWVLIVDLNIL